ncbi:serine/threonine protein kinase [Roseiconus nitratireducens]|uniref:non-specific serine/threonine protein kinase n=1 Tax=Roseiconus nitratireducens TaxID=2605748 RepID=A0A5M6D6P5_9BACT|nr:serine/threonine-protein kinase [Roseiconus nitratireducens]KAA5543181.1 serine/threonine protein kinase [Roseiconus nitratireducens]
MSASDETQFLPPQNGPGRRPPEPPSGDVANDPRGAAAEDFRQEDEDALDAILADYLQRLEDGQTPDPAQYLRQHPEYADELRSFFRNHHWIGDTPEPPPTSLCGSEIGSYQIESEIARGGMGVVYRARQKGLERPVAVKLISNGVLASDEERRRFRIEAEAAARLDHPGIISIYEIGTCNGHEYFSMALVEGPTLQSYVDQRCLDDAGAATMVRDVARAVGYAHRCGIIHRDLKPANILVNREGRPLVADFGLAKWNREGTMLTRTGQVLGTPNYMSPEQASGRDEIGMATDVYSLGAILYALLTGVPPHTGNGFAEVLRSVMQDEPCPPRSYRSGVSRELENVCLKAMRREVNGRYPNADALADDLDRFLSGETTSAASSGLIERVAREIGRDQHRDQFQEWHGTLLFLGLVIFVAHVVIFVLLQLDLPNIVAYWMPRLTMLTVIIGTIYYARDRSLSPRSIAERPVWSIWLGYLCALAVVNVLLILGDVNQKALFPLASALSGFAFIAMSGHIWGGSALAGIAFFLLAPLTAWLENVAPLLFGTTYLLSIIAISQHYKRSAKKIALPADTRNQVESETI